MPDRQPASRLQAVETSLVDAESDLATVLGCPTLFDSSDPVTARFHACLEIARLKVAASGSSWVAEQAVTDLERAWGAAVSEAQRVRWSRMSPGQRFRLRRARRLLDKARGDRGPHQLRTAQFFKALQLLDGILVLPAVLREDLRKAAANQSGPSGPVTYVSTYW